MRARFLFALLGAFLIFVFSDSANAQFDAFGDPGAAPVVSGGSGAFIPVEESVTGGVVPIGATAQVVVRFRNETAKEVETGQIRLYPSSTVSADVTLNQCEETPLPAGAECAIALGVKGLQAGAWRVEVLMSHTGRSRLVTANISGSVESSGDGADRLSSDIEATPEALDFGTLSDVQRLVQPIVFRNVTSNKIDIEEVYLDVSDQSGFELSEDCLSLEPGQACVMTVRWSPKLSGPSSGVLVLEHSGPAGLVSVQLSGQYNPGDVEQADVFPQAVPGKGLLIASQTEVDFGNDISTQSTITVSLVNAGDADLTIRDITITGSDNGLEFKGEGCRENLVLEPIEACPLTVEWSPTREGALLDDIQVLHDGARGVLVLPVRGEADGAVSKDSGAVLLSGRTLPLPGGERTVPTRIIDSSSDNPAGAGDAEGAGSRRSSGSSGVGLSSIANPARVLDGLRITSFSPRRAIVAGPSGSRIVFDDEEIVIGGVPWMVNIQRNGIEFDYADQKVLLLFDRSLSSSGSSGSSGSSSGGSSSDSE